MGADELDLRGQVYSACGTGKSLEAVLIAERLVPRGGIAVVLCPTLNLVAQTLETWQNSCPRPFSALAVASDETVSDSPVGIEDLPCPVTTDPDTIQSWITTPRTWNGLKRSTNVQVRPYQAQAVTDAVRGLWGRPGSPTIHSDSSAELLLVVGTHQSARRLGEGLLKARALADLLVVDEAHHTAGRLGDLHSMLVHDNKQLPARRRLYMTATPRLFTSYQQVDTDKMVAMDDESTFGPVLSQYQFSSAIRDGWLDDYELAVIGVRHQEVLAALRDSDSRAHDNIFAASLRETAAQIALAQAAKQYNLRRIIVFCPRIVDAQAFARTMPRTVASLPAEHRPDLPLHAAAVSSEMSMRQRDVELDHLRNPPNSGWTVLPNARIFAEGMDVPAVDGVVFTRPKRSSVDIVQAVGRAVRPHPDGRRKAIILVPVLLPDTPEDIGDIDEAGEFETLWQVVRALRAHDDILGVELDLRRKTWDVPGMRDTSIPEKIIITMPPGFDSDAWHNSLRVRLVRSASSAWWQTYGLAEEYFQKEGNLNIGPRHSTHNGVKLGHWIVVQRGRYRRGLLAPDRVSALEQIGMIWAPRTDRWQEMLDRAAAFRALHGHLAPPNRSEDWHELYGWLRDRRAEWRGGRLEQDREAQLARIDTYWYDVAVTRGLSAARQYVAEHGFLAGVPRKGFRISGIDLGYWIATCHAAMKNGTLEAQLADELHSMGIEWPKAAPSWDSRFREAEGFLARFGDLNAAARPGFDGLAKWLAKQRRDHEHGRLSSDRAEKLHELGFDFRSAAVRAWLDGLAAAQNFYERVGSLKVPSGHVEAGVRLDSFLQARRAEWREGRLPPDRVEALTALGMDWSPRDPGAEAGLQACQAYHAEHGDLWVSPRHVAADGFELGTWILAMRSRWRAGTLDDRLRDALDALGMVWEPERVSRERHLAAARKFRAEYGHLEVPRSYVTDDGVKLGSWIHKRRDAYRLGTIPADQMAALEALGITWSRQRAHRR